MRRASFHFSLLIGQTTLDFSVHRPSTSLSITANDEDALAMLEDMTVAVPLFVSKLEEASS